VVVLVLLVFGVDGFFPGRGFLTGHFTPPTPPPKFPRPSRVPRFCSLCCFFVNPPEKSLVSPPPMGAFSPPPPHCFFPSKTGPWVTGVFVFFFSLFSFLKFLVQAYLCFFFFAGILFPLYCPVAEPTPQFKVFFHLFFFNCVGNLHFPFFLPSPSICRSSLGYGDPFLFFDFPWYRTVFCYCPIPFPPFFLYSVGF